MLGKLWYNWIFFRWLEKWPLNEISISLVVWRRSCVWSESWQFHAKGVECSCVISFNFSFELIKFYIHCCFRFCSCCFNLGAEFLLELIFSRRSSQYVVKVYIFSSWGYSSDEIYVLSSWILSYKVWIWLSNFELNFASFSEIIFGIFHIVWYCYH